MRPISYAFTALIALAVMPVTAAGADLSDKIFDKAQEKMDQKIGEKTAPGSDNMNAPSATATPGGGPASAASKVAGGVPRLSAETIARVVAQYAPESLGDAAIRQWLADFPGHFGLSEQEAAALLAGAGPSDERLAALRRTLTDRQSDGPARLADVGRAPVKNYSFKEEAFQLSRAIAYGGEIEAPYQPDGVTVVLRVQPGIRAARVPMARYEAEVIKSALSAEDPAFVTEAVLSVREAEVRRTDGGARVIVDLALEEVALFTGTMEGEAGPVPQGRIRALDLDKWRVGQDTSASRAGGGPAGSSG